MSNHAAHANELAGLVGFCRGNDERSQVFGWLSLAMPASRIRDLLRPVVLGHTGASVYTRDAALATYARHGYAGLSELVTVSFATRNLMLKLRALAIAGRYRIDLGETFAPWAIRRVRNRAAYREWDFAELPLILLHVTRGDRAQVLRAVDSARDTMPPEDKAWLGRALGPPGEHGEAPDVNLDVVQQWAEETNAVFRAQSELEPPDPWDLRQLEALVATLRSRARRAAGPQSNSRGCGGP